MPKIDLLPCPFCGRKPKSIVNIQMYAIGCSFSKCHVYPCVVKKTPEEAAKVWNTRASGWIPCSERLPEQDGEYLVFTEYEDVFKCTFDSNEENKWGFEQDYHDPDTLGWAGTTWTAVETVTHWMPLPEKPETEDNT